MSPSVRATPSRPAMMESINLSTASNAEVIGFCGIPSNPRIKFLTLCTNFAMADTSAPTSIMPNIR